MLDFFVIFSKGGIVLWCFQNTQESYTLPINDLIQNVIIPEKTFELQRKYKQLMLKYKLDNEFELVYVVGYQSAIQLSYVDKLLTDMQLFFRDRFKNALQFRNYSQSFDCLTAFKQIVKAAEMEAKENEKPKMKAFEDSEKSKKTVASMIVKKDEKPISKPKTMKPAPEMPSILPVSPAKVSNSPVPASPSSPSSQSDGGSDGDVSNFDQIQKNKEKLMARKLKKPEDKSAPPKKKEKGKRDWGIGGKSDMQALDYSSPPENASTEEIVSDKDRKMVGTMAGNLADISTKLDINDDFDDEEYDKVEQVEVAQNLTQKTPGKSKGAWGVFGSLINVVAGAPLTAEQMAPALEKLKEHLISKNVASEVADKLCHSVGTKLEGKVLGSFQTVNAAVKNALQEACLQLLQPSRRIDLLGGALETKRRIEKGMTARPYVVTFCGVNGVGKSTNLAKICFWLLENKLRVLIAACDTFRSGAVEQLRTHVRRMSALHPPINGKNSVEVYEKGYGKDPADVAMNAINFARSSGFDVVLVDTAGRMQDNTPLMVALSKLIHVNQPDLVLFVGEALVGNDGVDQLVKFQQALLDNSIGSQGADGPTPRTIDGVVLTKFDTIDDKVGAAISMTYTTGKPIVFVGTGQTYADLANLNAESVVKALMK